VVIASSSEVRWEFDPTPLADAPFCLNGEHEVVKAACSGAAKEQSQVVNFSCDASKIAAAGIPCLILGPGDIAEAHTSTESICVEDLERGVEMYVNVARRLLRHE
jgi:acetylornithine deacetylase/succinyl-diaminopimelate desuccinylase-like protein